VPGTRTPDIPDLSCISRRGGGPGLGRGRPSEAPPAAAPTTKASMTREGGRHV